MSVKKVGSSDTSINKDCLTSDSGQYTYSNIVSIFETKGNVVPVLKKAFAP
jgi:hypothetical protein